MPIFGCITNILLIVKTVHFKLVLYKTVSWNVFYNAYELLKTNEKVQCTQDILYTYETRDVWKDFIGDTLYLSPRTLLM